jgi:hypothetical protein
VVVVHDLVVLLFDMIVFVVIFLLIGVFLVVLFFVTRMIMASIILMATVVSMFVMFALVALMVVAVLAMMIPVVQVMPASNRKMSCLLFLWLLLLLELVKDAGCFIGNLTLLRKSHKPKRVHGHCFVCFCKIKLMHLGLHEKNLFAFLLRCGQKKLLVANVWEPNNCLEVIPGTLIEVVLMENFKYMLWVIADYWVLYPVTYIAL